MSSDKAEKLLDSIVSRVDNITEPDYKSEALSKIAEAFASIRSTDKAEKLLSHLISLTDTMDDYDKSTALSQIAEATFIFGTIKLYCGVLTL